MALKLTSWDIIRKPVITEKSMSGMEAKKYTFLVHVDADKTMIKNAVEEAFGVTVESVKTQNRLGNPRVSRDNAPRWLWRTGATRFG